MQRPESRWKFIESDPESVKLLADEFALKPATARLMANRGITDSEKARGFLSGFLRELPDPFGLKGMQQAVERIEQAIRQKENVCVYGDYDVDGVTSVSLLKLFFKNIPYPLAHTIPLRKKDGYGLNPDMVERLHKAGHNLLVTVDNGISDIEEIAYARKLGMDVVVVDHHLPGENLPPANAIVDPRQPGCTYPDKEMAAVGLTFLLIVALRRHLTECGLLSNGKDLNLKKYLDIVALGTVADLVPLTGVNRLFVRHGLPLLSRTTRPGLLALKEVSSIPEGRELGHYEVGFQLAPKINAGGRLGSAEVGVDLLTTDDLSLARKLATKLHKENSARRLIGERILNEALYQIEESGDDDAPAFVLHGSDWHEGVIGIVASRIVDRYHRPTLVIAGGEEGPAKGSCRSIEGLHLKNALDKLSDKLVRFGGHKMAAGFSIEADRIDEFRESFCKLVKEELSEEDFKPLLLLDGALGIEDLDTRFMQELETLSPFGMGNPSPLLVIENVEVSSCHLMKRKHWKLSLRQNGASVEAIGFNMDHFSFEKGEKLDLAFIPEYNEFAGRRRLQLRIKDVHKK